MLAVWLDGSTLVSINEVNLRLMARLIIIIIIIIIIRQLIRRRNMFMKSLQRRLLSSGFNIRDALRVIYLGMYNRPPRLTQPDHPFVDIGN